MPEETKLTPAERARQQAEAYGSVMRGTELELIYPDGRPSETVIIPPHPNLGIMPDDRLEAYEELQFMVDTKCDREPDVVIPESKNEKTGVVLPGETLRGRLKDPLRIDGELLKPPYRVQVVQTVLGEELYNKLKAAGMGAGDVQRIWSQQSFELKIREASDPK